MKVFLVLMPTRKAGQQDFWHLPQGQGDQDGLSHQAYHEDPKRIRREKSKNNVLKEIETYLE